MPIQSQMGICFAGKSTAAIKINGKLATLVDYEYGLFE